MDGLTIVHVTTWAVAPEDSADIAPGRYAIRAVLETPWWLPTLSGWRGRTSSAPVEVTVRAKADGAWEESGADQTAEFYLTAHRFEDAERIAHRVDWPKREESPRLHRAWTLARRTRARW